jgi:DNA gyrase/topoisomerase IV subunit A
MTFSDKIDEWIKEAEERPASALLVLKLVANRLRELTERNEELEEYQKRIAYLEYQLNLLKRRLGGDESALAELAIESETLSLLVYNAHGRILRLEMDPDSSALGRISGEMSANGELPRLLAVPSHEEVLLLFTSGRISTCPVAQIPSVKAGGDWAWDQVALPEEPHAGELLACVMPLSRLPLADFFLQTSRRGCVKKTMTSMAQSILANHYLGRGAIQKSDQSFDALLCQKKDRLALVTYEGHLLGLDVDDLSYTVEERIRLNATDFVVASFALRPEDSLFCLTQTGKAVVRDGSVLELSKSPLARGQALIPSSRLDQGVRFIGAVPIRDADRVAVLDAEGNLTLHLADTVTGAGSIHAAGLILSIGVIPATGGKSHNP